MKPPFFLLSPLENTELLIKPQLLCTTMRKEANTGDTLPPTTADAIPSTPSSVNYLGVRAVASGWCTHWATIHSFFIVVSRPQSSSCTRSFAWPQTKQKLRHSGWPSKSGTPLSPDTKNLHPRWRERNFISISQLILFLLAFFWLNLKLLFCTTCFKKAEKKFRKRIAPPSSLLAPF